MPGRLGAPRAFLNLCRSRRYERLRIGELPDPQAILFRDSVGIRTQDPQLRRLLLYPTELRNRLSISDAVRFAAQK